MDGAERSGDYRRLKDMVLPWPVTVSEMSVEDIDDVLEIEQTAFGTPWSRRAFVQEITENALAHYIVLRIGSQVVGYGGMWIILDEAHITNIAIHPGLRRQGLGSFLLNEMISRARARGAKKVTLEVRVSNVPAQNLYKRLGFVSKGIRKSYYTDTGEDAIIMWKDL